MLRHLDLLVFKNIANNLNCGSSNDVYLFSFKAHSKKYIDTIDIFGSGFNNHKSAHRSFIEGNTVKQASFHTHFEDGKHHSMSDWESLSLIKQMV